MTAPHALAPALRAIVGARHVRTARADAVAYEMDGLSTLRRRPGVVVLPGRIRRHRLIRMLRRSNTRSMSLQAA
jgi:hypothetical protein